MNVIALLTLLALPGNVDITLAPDQPLPYVYTDDPLLIELRSEADGDALLHVSVQGSHEETPAPLADIRTPLRAHGTQWCAVEGGSNGAGILHLAGGDRVWGGNGGVAGPVLPD